MPGRAGDFNHRWAFGSAFHPVFGRRARMACCTVRKGLNPARLMRKLAPTRKPDP
jgi:hypothetical protein